MDKSYVDTVRLLLEAAPEVFRAGCFAMKGGTALNLFVQDMPRLSVDIDVVYVAHEKSRDVALREIGAELTALRGHTGEVWQVFFTADGKTLVSSGQDGTRIWRTVTEEEVRARIGK